MFIHNDIKKKVSIITPTYNHEKYIEKCIHSVLAQKYSNWEMIIVNDGSTDNTESVILALIKNEPRIKYFHQLNKGLFKLSETYNLALENSTGELIAILEGDDYWYETYLSTQIAFFNDPKIGFTWCRCNVVDENNAFMRQYPRKINSSIFNNPNCSVLQTILESFPVPVSWIFKKDDLQKIGGFIQHPAIPTVDLSTILEYCRKNNFHFNNTPLVAYRRQIKQATRNYTVEIAKGMKSTILDFINTLKHDELKNIGLSIEEINVIIKNKIIMAYSVYGRSCLVRKEFIEARKSFKKSVFASGGLLLSWRIKSALGFMFSYIHLDLEWMAKIAGKNTYS